MLLSNSLAAIPVLAVAVITCLAILAVAATMSPASSSSPTSTTPVSPAAAPALDAGIARIDSVSGVLVLDAPSTNPSSYTHQALTVFAATSAGDRKADVRYAVDWDRAAAAYRKDLRRLWAQKTELAPGDYAGRLKELKAQYAVPTRSVWVQDSSTHTATWAMFSADPLTRRLVRAKYIKMPYSTGLPPTPDHTDSWRVWELATQLQAALEAGQGIQVSDEVRDGVPVYRVDVPASGGYPAWSTFVDRATGLALSVAREAPGGSDRDVSSPYHVRDLRLNQPLSPDAFTISPDYRGMSHIRNGPEIKTLDLAGDEVTERWLPPDQLSSVAPASQLVPAVVPRGFTLSRLRVIGAENTVKWVALIYTRGLSMIYFWSGGRVPEYVVSDDGDHLGRPDRVPAFDRRAWPSLGGYSHGMDATARVSGGALAGDPAALAGAPGETTLVEAWNSRDEATLSGDATRAQLLDMAGSLRPLRLGAWHRPMTGLLALVALLIAATFMLGTVWVWARAYGTSPAESRPRFSALVWPLVGAVVLVAGACLDWHALHTGLAWGIRGWSEPLGRWVVAAALAGVACAAWVQLAHTRRRRQAARTAALFFSGAALAGAAFALAYLPAIARFTVDPGTGQGVTQESWLLRIFGSSFSPSAAAGLYVSIVGALLLFVGVLLLRRRTSRDEALETPPESPSPPAAGAAPARS